MQFKRMKRIYSVLLVSATTFFGSNAYAQTLSSPTANGLLTESSSVYNLTWYSNRNNPYEKTITVNFSGFSANDKVTITGSAKSDTAYNQVKSNVSGFTSWLDVTGWANGNSRNLCFNPGTCSGSIVLSFQRLGAGGTGTFYNDIYINVANSSCGIVSAKTITVKCTMVVANNVYNYTSQATLSNWGDATSWSPSRNSVSTTDLLVFDQGTTPLDVNVNVTNETVKSVIVQPYSDVTFREEGSAGTITISGGEFTTHATSTVRTNGYDTLRFALTNGTNADINGNFICETPDVTGDKARVVFSGGGSVYFGGDVDIQKDNSLYLVPTSNNTVYFDGASQTLRGSGEIYIHGLSNITVGTGLSTGSTLSLQRPLPILGVLTLKNYADVTSSSKPVSSSAADWNAWVPNLQIKNNGTYKGRIATLGTSATVSGGAYFEMYSNGIRTYRTIAFPMKNAMHLSQITDDLIISGVYSGTNQDSMDHSCGYCKASSYAWNETTSTWDSINASSTATKINPGQGMLLFFRGLLNNGLGTPWTSANPGNIDFKGELFFGSKTVTLAKNGTGGLAGYNLIANPYPCHIDFRNLTRSNVQDKFQVYDPTTKSYNIWNNTTGTVQKSGTSKFTNGSNAHVIEIGASFFAIASSNGGTITFDEADKTTTGPDATAFRMVDSGMRCNQVRAELRYAVDSIKFADQFFLEWNATYSNVDVNSDAYDVNKIYGGYLGLGTKTPNNDWMSMDYRPSTGEKKQTFALETRTMDRNEYRINFNTCVNNNSYSITLLDKETNTLAPISEDTDYKFQTSDQNTYFNDRFELIVEELANSTKTATKSNFHVYPNPVSNGKLNIATAENTQIVSIEVFDIQGRNVARFNKVQNHEIQLPSNLAKGYYTISLLTSNGMESTKILIN